MRSEEYLGYPINGMGMSVAEEVEEKTRRWVGRESIDLKRTEKLQHTPSLSRTTSNYTSQKEKMKPTFITSYLHTENKL